MTRGEVVQTATDSVEEGVWIWSKNHPEIRMTKAEWDDLSEDLIISVRSAFAVALGVATTSDGEGTG